jgi:hypothetical protein
MHYNNKNFYIKHFHSVKNKQLQILGVWLKRVLLCFFLCLLRHLVIVSISKGRRTAKKEKVNINYMRYILADKSACSG